MLYPFYSIAYAKKKRRKNNKAPNDSEPQQRTMRKEKKDVNHRSERTIQKSVLKT